MKLLMTADAVGGVWTYALELARALAPYGIEIALAIMGNPPSSMQRRELRAVPNVTLYESRYKLEWMDDPWPDVDAAGDWLLDLDANVAPDIVHLNGYAHAALAWNAPKLVVCHSCVLSWWQAVKGEPAPGIWCTYRQRVSDGVHAADYLVAPSETMLSAIISLYGRPSCPTLVVPNGRDAALFPPREKHPYIFSAGRLWDEAKNIAALESVSSSLEWPVYVAGNSRGAGTSAQPQPSIRHCHSLGFLDARELSGWLASASIFCLPARYEPFGLGALEAALAGCALVLGDIPSLREIWDSAAIFAPPDDHEALAAALARLIENSSYRRKCASRARLRAAAFTPMRMAQRYLSIYNQMLAAKALANRKPRPTSTMEAAACV